MRFAVEPSRAIPEYVFRFLCSPLGREQMRGKAKRAVAQSSINQGDDKSIVLPLPSLTMQQRIAEIFSLLDRQRQTEENKRRALEELFKTLLNNIMTGKIRAKQLEMEP